MLRIVLFVLAALFLVFVAKAVIGALAWVAVIAVIVAVAALLLGIRTRVGSARPSRGSSSRRR